MWVLGVMCEKSEPPLVWVSPEFRTPPMIMSPENTVLLVPSEKVRVSMPQSSTSTGLALMKGRSSGLRPAATLPTSAGGGDPGGRLPRAPRPPRFQPRPPEARGAAAGVGMPEGGELARRHRRDDHRSVQGGRRADVDDVDVAVGEQRGKIAITLADAMLSGEVDDVIAARRHRRHLDLDAVDPLVGVH